MNKEEIEKGNKYSKALDRDLYLMLLPKRKLANSLVDKTQALLDIKELIEKDKSNFSTFAQREDTIKIIFNKEEQDILDIINKTLGEKNGE